MGEEYYDWHKTLAYDADVTMVIGARGLGKTFGLRRQFVRDYLNNGYRFVEIVRYKDELADVSQDYFERISELDEFEGIRFKADSHNAYLARNDINEKPKWEMIGYFIAMTQHQRKKKKTYDHVRRLLLDEAIIERTDRYHKYLPNEFMILGDIVDTVSRERPGVKGTRPRVYLLGNACDIANPYFMHYGVGTNLKFGYRWYSNKTFLLHYVESASYSSAKARDTVAGRMISGSDWGRQSIDNTFVLESTEFVHEKPKRARFRFGVICNGMGFGVWVDESDGYYYVTNSIPRNSDRRVFTLTRSDDTANYIAIRRASPVLKNFAELWYMGVVRFDTVSCKERFYQVLDLFGIR